MRISIAIVMVMLLSACNAGSGRYLADRGDSSTSTDSSSQQMLPLAANEDRDPEGTETGDQGPGPAAGSSGIGSTVPDTNGNDPTVTTSTPVAAVTVDPQEVESALAEFDELLGSLVSAISSMDQAFEQGE